MKDKINLKGNNVDKKCCFCNQFHTIPNRNAKIAKVFIPTEQPTKSFTKKSAVKRKYNSDEYSESKVLGKVRLMEMLNSV